MGSDDLSHVPVLRDEVVRLLITRSDGAYLDLTVGGGGHLKALSDRLDGAARLYGLDRDSAAVNAAGATLRDVPQRAVIVNASYRDAAEVAAGFEDRKFDGVLIDLGLSSIQLDDPNRGFTHRFDGPLDMRFDPQSSGPTAADIVNTADERELNEILRTYGEEHGARRLAQAIVRERQTRMILTTGQLAGIIERHVPRHESVKTLARVFQAFRIAVNRELEQLEQTLPMLLDLLSVGGRVAVIAYHSLEDRLVKRFFQQEARGCICPPEAPVCVCGRAPRLKLITRRPIVPTPEEIARNSRARSAKLRVAERVAG